MVSVEQYLHRKQFFILHVLNYIYVVGKNDAFRIEARKTKAFLSGETSFNTILIAEVDTNTADPIATRYYKIT